MQNQFVFSAGKSFVGHFFSGSIVKSIGLPQQRNLFPLVKNDLQSRNISENRSNVPLLLPGGGLGKLQGSFKEEQYFNVHEHMLVAQLQQTGYRLKCETSSNSNWKEFERMANDLTQLTAVRQSGQLCKHRNCPEESFFLQEQRSLLERIIDALRRIFANRSGGMPMPPPYGGGYYPYGPQYYHSREEKQGEENKEDENKSENDDDANKTATNEEEDADKPLSENGDRLLPEDQIPQEPPSDSGEPRNGSGDGQSGDSR